jgi:hypothetical protein
MHIIQRNCALQSKLAKIRPSQIVGGVPTTHIFQNVLSVRSVCGCGERSGRSDFNDIYPTAKRTTGIFIPRICGEVTERYNIPCEVISRLKISSIIFAKMRVEGDFVLVAKPVHQSGGT